MERETLQSDSEAQKQNFIQRIEDVRTDRTALRAIADELQQLNESWARSLRLKVLSMSLKAKAKSDIEDDPELSEVRKTLGTYAASIGLPAPDGRQLYQYRISEKQFLNVQSFLQNAATDGKLKPGREEALFVLWAAEWFRRHYKGGTRRWEEIGAPLGLNLSDSQYRVQMADRGLAVWGLKAVQFGGMKHRLLAIARQGGFPVAAIEAAEGGKHWADHYLQALVGHLMSRKGASSEMGMELAGELASHVPSTWRTDDFYSLSADLARAVVNLRAVSEAEAAREGIPASAWLDIHRPDWRNTLPIVLDSDASKRLIDGMMRAEVLKGGAGVIRANRLLVRTADAYQPALRLELSGQCSQAELQAPQDYGRLRAVASGALGRYISGELAIFEPPGQGSSFWSVQSLRRASPQFTAPFDVAAEIELRSEGTGLKRLRLKGGEPVSSDILICIPDDVEGQATDTDRLKVIAEGGGSFREDPVFVHIPSSWQVGPAGDTDEAECLGKGSDGCQLWRVSGHVRLRDDDDSIYGVITGQTQEKRDRLRLTGKSRFDLTPIRKGVRLYSEQPTLELLENSRSRRPEAGEVIYRAHGVGDRWRDMGRSVSEGVFDIAWRDRQSGITRDKVTIAILPPTVEIASSAAKAKQQVSVSGWAGALELEGFKQINATDWVEANRSAGRSQAKVQFAWPNGSCLEATFDVEHSSGFSDWEGRMFAPESIFALADAKEIVAIASHEERLSGYVRGRDGGRVPGTEMTWHFDRALPLSSIRRELEWLLRPLNDIDAEVCLSFGDREMPRWRVKEFGVELKSGINGLFTVGDTTRGDIRVMGRQLSAPLTPRDFGPFGLSLAGGYSPIVLPLGLKGDWLIYLQSHRRVLSRPFLFKTNQPLNRNPDALGRVMAIGDRSERDFQLGELLERIDSTAEKPHALARQLIELVCGLDGLPPATFDILKAVSNHPRWLPYLAVFASEDELPAILKLSEALPFAWCLFTVEAWESAATSFYSDLVLRMGAIENASKYATEAMMARSRRLADELPFLSVIIGQTQSAKPLHAIVNSFLNRLTEQGGARGEFQQHGAFRPAFSDKLPDWSRYDKSFETRLDAPCVAALAARGLIEVDAGQIHLIKLIEQRHPIYFREAFEAYFQERKHG